MFVAIVVQALPFLVLGVLVSGAITALVSPAVLAGFLGSLLTSISVGLLPALSILALGGQLAGRREVADGEHQLLGAVTLSGQVDRLQVDRGVGQAAAVAAERPGLVLEGHRQDLPDPLGDQAVLAEDPHGHVGRLQDQVGQRPVLAHPHHGQGADVQPLQALPDRERAGR